MIETLSLLLPFFFFSLISVFVFSFFSLGRHLHADSGAHKLCAECVRVVAARQRDAEVPGTTAS
jgi:hypothetical protein